MPGGYVVFEMLCGRKILKITIRFIIQHIQSRLGKVFEMLADLTDEDGALAEMEDLESMNEWIFDVDQLTPPEEPPDNFRDEPPIEPAPTGENLLDQASRDKLPPLYSGVSSNVKSLW